MTVIKMHADPSMAVERGEAVQVIGVEDPSRPGLDDDALATRGDPLGPSGHGLVGWEPGNAGPGGEGQEG